MEEEWDDYVKSQMKRPYTLYFWKSSCGFRVVKKIYNGIKINDDGKKVYQFGEETLVDSRPQSYHDRVAKSHASQSLNIPDSWNAEKIGFSVDSENEAKKAPIYFIFLYPEHLKIV